MDYSISNVNVEPLRGAIRLLPSLRTGPIDEMALVSRTPQRVAGNDSHATQDIQTSSYMSRKIWLAHLIALRFDEDVQSAHLGFCWPYGVERLRSDASQSLCYFIDCLRRSIEDSADARSSHESSGSSVSIGNRPSPEIEQPSPERFKADHTPPMTPYYRSPSPSTYQLQPGRYNLSPPRGHAK